MNLYSALLWTHL